MTKSFWQSLKNKISGGGMLIKYEKVGPGVSKQAHFFLVSLLNNCPIII